MEEAEAFRGAFRRETLEESAFRRAFKGAFRAYLLRAYRFEKHSRILLFGDRPLIAAMT